MDEFSNIETERSEKWCRERRLGTPKTWTRRFSISSRGIGAPPRGTSGSSSCPDRYRADPHQRRPKCPGWIKQDPAVRSAWDGQTKPKTMPSRRGLEVTASDVGEFRLAGRDVTQIINNYQSMNEEQLRILVGEMVQSAIMEQIEGIDAGSESEPQLTIIETKRGVDALIQAEAAQKAGITFDPDEIMKLARTAIFCGRYAISEGYTREALRLYQKEGDSPGEIWANNLLSDC